MKIFIMIFVYSILSVTGSFGSGNGEEAPQQRMNAELSYWCYIYPGFVPRVPHWDDVIMNIKDTIRQETGISLNAHIQHYVPAGNSNRSSEEFFSKIKTAAVSGNPPDLIYTDSTWTVQELFKFELIGSVDGLIEKNAPRIYRSFPKQYWESREQTGIRGVPVRQYKPADNFGVWIIKNDFLKRNDITAPANLDDLLAVLGKCARQEGRPLGELRNRGEDLAISMSDDQTFMLSLSGNKVIGNGEIYFDYGAGRFFPLNDSAGQKELKKYIDTPLIHVKPVFDIIRILPWSVLHLSYNVQFDILTDLNIRTLNELFESEDYVIIEDTDLLAHVPLDNHYRFYISEASEKKETALQVLDYFINSGIIYETAGDVLGPLYDQSVYSVNSVYPDRVKSGYRKFIRQLTGTAAAVFDPEFIYRTNLMSRGLFVPNPVREEDAYPGYVPPLNSRQIEVLISEGASAEMFKPYRAEIEETAACMQRVFK
jgi:hypothetical protein